MLTHISPRIMLVLDPSNTDS